MERDAAKIRAAGINLDGVIVSEQSTRQG